MIDPFTMSMLQDLRHCLWAYAEESRALLLDIPHDPIVKTRLESLAAKLDAASKTTHRIIENCEKLEMKSK